MRGNGLGYVKSASYFAGYLQRFPDKSRSDIIEVTDAELFQESAKASLAPVAHYT